MDDTIALIIGRVILAWAALDTQLHFTLEDLNRRTTEEFKFESRFKHRIQLLRKLLVKAGGNKPTMSRFDNFAGRVEVFADKRGKLAHGIVDWSQSGNLQSFDFATARTGSPELKPDWFSLTPEDAKSLPSEILKLKGELGAWHSEISQLFS